MKKPGAGVYFFGLGALIIVAIIGLKVYQNATAPSLDSFAQCLTEKGLKMYGAWWCPHCEDQKQAFGKSFQYINYTECSPDGSRLISQECKDKGIESVPVWELADGSRNVGGLSLESLSQTTGCVLPTR